MPFRLLVIIAAAISLIGVVLSSLFVSLAYRQGCGGALWERVAVALPAASNSGFAYAVPLGSAHMSSVGGTSPAIVLENGKPLSGPANALHDDIRKRGLGAFSFWGGDLLFSASDNSNPNENGRQYEVCWPQSWLSGLPRGFTLAAAATLLLLLGLASGTLWQEARRRGGLRMLPGLALQIVGPQPVVLCSRPVLRAALLVGLLTLLPHAVVMLGAPLIIEPDTGSYLRLAGEIQAGSLKLENMPGDRVPGYPFLIAMAQAMAGGYFVPAMKFIQHAMGWASGMLLFFIVLLLCGRLWYAVLVGIVSSAMLQVLVYQNNLLTEAINTFMLALAVCATLLTLRRRSGELFVLTMLIFAAIAWVRPVLTTIWLMPVGAWLLNEAVQGALAAVPGWSSRLRGLLHWRLLRAPAVGLALYGIVVAPLALTWLPRATDDMVGTWMWFRSVYFFHMEDPEEPGIRMVRDAYPSWRERNPAFRPADTWRHPYVASAILCMEFKTCGRDASIAMATTMRRIVDNDPARFAKRYAFDIMAFFNGQEDHYRLQSDAALAEHKPAWALPLATMRKTVIDGGIREPYKGYIEAADRWESPVMRGFYRLMAESYAALRRQLNLASVTFYLLCLSLPLAALLFRPVEYVFLLVVIVYHSLVPTIILPPTTRYRIPIEGYLLAIDLAALVYIAALVAVALKRLPAPGARMKGLEGR